MMFFGVAVLPLMVMVVVDTAPAGVDVGLLGDDPDELELLGLLELLPHAPIAKAAATASAAAAQILPFVLMCIAPLDPNNASMVTSA